MSERMDERRDREARELSGAAGEPGEAERESAASPRRRRRSDQYHTEEDRAEPARSAAEKAPRFSLDDASETAREVASRYRREQNLPLDKTRRMVMPSGRGAPERPGNGTGAGPAQERVGYAPGRMGLSAADRARMSAEGRERLRQESQGRPLNGGNRLPLQDPRYGREPMPGPKPRKSRGRRILILLAALVLVFGGALGALLLLPNVGPLDSVKQSVQGLLGMQSAAPGVIAFSASWPDQEGIPSSVDFLVSTRRGVTGVRVRTATGETPALDWQIEDRDTGMIWQATWQAEKAYAGLVTLEIETGAEWKTTDMTAQIQMNPALEAVTEPEGEGLPVVFETDQIGPQTVTEAPPEEGGEASAETGEASESGEDPEIGEQTEDAEPAQTGENPEEEPFPEEEEDPAGEDAEPEAGEDFPEEEGAFADPDDPERNSDGEETARAESEEDPEDTAEAEPAGDRETQAEAGGENPEPAADGDAPADTPTRRLLKATAAESADPSLISTTVVYNGKKKVSEYARADREKIHMPALDEYTKQKIGVLTFRTDAFRQNAAVGTVKGLNSLQVAWTADATSIKGAGQTYYGIGWVGQPAIVKWSKQVREKSDMYDAKKEKTGLKEVIACGLDGRIYFLDLADGTPTRNSIKLGYPMKASPSVHPGGAPYMTVGQFARKMANNHTGTIGLRQYNLYLMKELSLIDGLDGKNNRPYNAVGSFETSALIDRTTGTMITAGTNGMLYLTNLNAEFDYNEGTYTQSPVTVVMKSKAKGEKDASTAVEASVAMYDKYVYYADMGGILRCVDTDTLTPVWAVSLGDAVESTPALDWHGEDGLDLYTATLLSARKSGDAEVKCLDALSGEVRWTASFGVSKDKKNKTVSGFRASPVIGQNGLGDYLYYTVNNLSADGREKLGVGDKTAALIALKKADGEVAWAVGLPGTAYSSPVAVYDDAGNGAIIQCAADGSIRMLDGLTGRELDSLNLEAAIEASPAVYDGMLVIGTSEKNKNSIFGIRIE